MKPLDIKRTVPLSERVGSLRYCFVSSEPEYGEVVDLMEDVGYLQAERDALRAKLDALRQAACGVSHMWARRGRGSAANLALDQLDEAIAESKME